MYIYVPVWASRYCLPAVLYVERRPHAMRPSDFDQTNLWCSRTRCHIIPRRSTKCPFAVR